MSPVLAVPFHVLKVCFINFILSSVSRSVKLPLSFKNLNVFLFRPLHVTCPAYLILGLIVTLVKSTNDEARQCVIFASSVTSSGKERKSGKELEMEQQVDRGQEQRQSKQ